MKEELQVGQSDIYYYTDSRIVIGYLTNTERRFKRYVGRRIELISNMTARSEWHYQSQSGIRVAPCFYRQHDNRVTFGFGN